MATNNNNVNVGQLETAQTKIAMLNAQIENFKRDLEEIKSDMVESGIKLPQWKIDMFGKCQNSLNTVASRMCDFDADIKKAIIAGK